MMPESFIEKFLKLYSVTMCDPNITIIIMTSDINSIYYHNSKYILKASTEYKK